MNMPESVRLRILDKIGNAPAANVARILTGVEAYYSSEIEEDELLLLTHDVVDGPLDRFIISKDCSTVYYKDSVYTYTMDIKRLLNET